MQLSRLFMEGFDFIPNDIHSGFGNHINNDTRITGIAEVFRICEILEDGIKETAKDFCIFIPFRP